MVETAQKQWYIVHTYSGFEERVRETPEQYHWLHKRFKTRPPGEPSLY